MRSAVRDATSLRDLWIGLDREVPVAGGGSLRYANLDNAASTPPLRVVRDEVDRFLEWYASVHRGTGFKSRLSTDVYESARHAVGDLVGADADRDAIVFTKHTTESINLAAAALTLTHGDSVAVSVMEHHSNMLPWRRRGPVRYVEVDAAGRLDLDSLEDVLRTGAGRVKLVALTAASNVTGYINPVHEAARLAHRHGARILVDAAQSVAHRPTDMLPHDDPSHLDFIAFSGHKMYAPYGAGVLVAPREVLALADPLLVGGGTVDLVTREDVLWSAAPERNEGGSPNTVGAVALAVALRAIRRIGSDVIERIESELARRALRGLSRIDGVRVLGSSDLDLTDRLGVVTFTLEGHHHSYVASVLANEWGIGVRDGCFCAHPYLLRLLQVPSTCVAETAERIRGGDKSDIPGAIRASFAPYNEIDEVDRLLEGLKAIVAGRTALEYEQDRSTGAFDPVNWSPRWDRAFTLMD